MSRANSSTPVGTLNGPKQDVSLQASGQMDKAADYRQVIVAWRNGSPVRLDEIAKVYDGVENDKTATWFNGTRSIVLAIYKQPDANTVAVVDAVNGLKNLEKAPEARKQAILADRIVVLSNRPGRIVHVETLTLARPRGLDSMTTPEFVAVCDRLRRLFAKAEGV